MSTDITSSDSQIEVSACTDIVGTPFSPEPEPETTGVVSVQSRTDLRPKRVRMAVQTTFSSCCDQDIDRAARMGADVVECGRKGCNTRFADSLLGSYTPDISFMLNVLVLIFTGLKTGFVTTVDRINARN